MADTNTQEKIEARKKLVASAKSARTQGIPQYEWENAQIIREFVSQAGLQDAIVEHIAAWVWTFRRR